jgi:hypothetical protein
MSIKPGAFNSSQYTNSRGFNLRLQFTNRAAGTVSIRQLSSFQSNGSLGEQYVYRIVAQSNVAGKPDIVLHSNNPNDKSSFIYLPYAQNTWIDFFVPARDSAFAESLTFRFQVFDVACGAGSNWSSQCMTMNNAFRTEMVNWVQDPETSNTPIAQMFTSSGVYPPPNPVGAIPPATGLNCGLSASTTRYRLTNLWSHSFGPNDGPYASCQ